MGANRLSTALAAPLHDRRRPNPYSRSAWQRAPITPCGEQQRLSPAAPAAGCTCVLVLAEVTDPVVESGRIASTD